MHLRVTFSFLRVMLMANMETICLPPGKAGTAAQSPGNDSARVLPQARVLFLATVPKSRDRRLTQIGFLQILSVTIRLICVIRVLFSINWN